MWYGNTRTGQFHLATVKDGRRFVMGFGRAGMHGAQPRFQERSRMVDASELVLYDVDRSVRGKTAAKNAESVYREDFSVIDHPDARLIAAAPMLLEALKLAEELHQVGILAAPDGLWDRVQRARRDAIATATGEGSRTSADTREAQGVSPERLAQKGHPNE
jgi:hypothetical protein